MAIIESGVSTLDVLTVDPISKAARQSLYDINGNLLVPSNRGAIAATAGGLLLSGADYKIARSLRSDMTGALRTNAESLILYDNSEGAAYNSNTWIETAASMTVTQSATAGRLFNAGSSVTASQGIMHVSQKNIPFTLGTTLLAVHRVRATAHFANNIQELGFGSPSSAVALTATNGAHWRKDTSGQWLPVFCINSVEILGTPISNATFIAAIATTDYAIFTVEVRHSSARFCVYTQGGVLVTAQDLDLTSGAAGVSGFAVTSLQAFQRTWNSGTVTTAVQMFVDEVSISLLDSMQQRPYLLSQASMGFSSIQSPTTYAQTANYTNSVAPTARALSNTAGAEATTILDGFISGTAPVGAATDLILIGFQVPVGKTFIFHGIRVSPPLNQGAAIATTDTVIAYALGFNGSAVSLATGSPNNHRPKILSGYHTGIVGLAIGKQYSGTDVQYQSQAGIAVNGGRFFHVIARVLVGTATASQTILWQISVDGIFE